MIHIEISERTFHFKQPAGTSRGVYTRRHSYFLTVTDDARPGIKGFGECATLPDLSCDAIPEYETILRQLCKTVETLGKLMEAQCFLTLLSVEVKWAYVSMGLYGWGVSMKCISG